MRRLLPILSLSAAVLLAACQNPDGTVNVPASLALGAGVALAGVAIASANDGPRRNHYYQQPRHGRPHHGYGHRRW